MDPALAALVPYGLDANWVLAAERAGRPHAMLGRVASVHYGGLFVRTADGVLLAVPSGALRRARKSEADAKPAVGDWVLLDPPTDGGPARLVAVLPRRTRLVRRAAGGDDLPQVVAANVDVALLCMAFGANFNVRRLERYLALAEAGDVRPCVVLTKVDGQPDETRERALAEVSALRDELEVHAVSAPEGQGLERLIGSLPAGSTAVLLGSSGVGKSTLLNALAGTEHMAAAAVRSKDDKGRHTTTHRELFLLPSGALVIDTPGLREVGLMGEEESVRRPRRGRRAPRS